MCSILGLLDLVETPDALRSAALERSRRQRHRGPDWSGVHADDGALLCHERLAVVDVETGAQPLRSADGGLALAVNGEIYNHRDLRAGAASDFDYQTGSDCEVILGLYAAGLEPEAICEALNGIFAFVLRDVERGRYLVARDPVGVVPLYWGRDEHGQLVVASEMKALHDLCRELDVFPPGHVYVASDGEEGERIRYWTPQWRAYDAVAGSGEPGDGRRDPQEDPEEDPEEAEIAERLHAALDAAVARQLMSDVPYGVLLSGGLDSSIIAVLAARHASRRIETDEREEAWWPRLHTFSIGLEGSPDLAAAAKVAEHLGSVHHELHYTIQEGLDALRDVIWHIETYDVTTIRASTPMYLMARRIRAMGVKMVLSGEGADEIFGGYLYFHKAPNAREFHRETVRKLDALYSYDCLRANKSMAAWSVEARVPFLDRDFLDVAMSIDPRHKMTGPGRMEKHVLRRAFADLLPDELAWRQKEQFSDGVGYGWIDSLRAHAESRITPEQLERARYRFPENPPATAEAYLYRDIFEDLFPSSAAAATVPGGKSIACSTPAALAWDAAFAESADPSGRAVRGVHADSWEG